MTNAKLALPWFSKLRLSAEDRIKQDEMQEKLLAEFEAWTWSLPEDMSYSKVEDYICVPFTITAILGVTPIVYVEKSNGDDKAVSQAVWKCGGRMVYAYLALHSIKVRVMGFPEYDECETTAALMDFLDNRSFEVRYEDMPAD